MATKSVINQLFNDKIAFMRHVHRMCIAKQPCLFSKMTVKIFGMAL